MFASDKQTLIDLEFNVIIEWLEQYAIEKTALKKIKDLTPSNDFSRIEFDLNQLHELRSIRISNESFPAVDFEELEVEIKLLKIHNAVISIEGFRRIYQASNLVNRLVSFFENQRRRYPNLEKIVENCEINYEINKRIDLVFDRAGNVKDDASPQLLEIRHRIKSLRNQINRNFDRELRKLLKDQILGDVTEGFINERRVLSVQSSFKRKVPGNVHGSSKTGSLTYVEPQANVPLNNEMEFLLDDERKEIQRILRQLTSEISIYYKLIKSYQQCLVDFDFLNAKCRLALEMNAVLPLINRKTEFDYLEAFHPILRNSNSLVKKDTKSQSIRMNATQRMVVISGPNAGGKSITLKTVGLLQLMLQSGLLLPVNETSKACFFQQIYSDIGDNQSIENELSTYSYRLQRMNHFLKASNHRTLLLLDEFGTGSDPELGGALAEVFFEELYKKSAFAVITTHYSNIKLKANALKNAVNGCMLFNTSTLKPKYEFALGQPGSSFTFEVARMNGINPDLISSAKGLLDEKKVMLDRLLNELQSNKNELDRLIQENKESQVKAHEARNLFIQKKEHYENRIKSQQSLIEQNNKLLSVGKKMMYFIEKFNLKSQKKDANMVLWEEVKNFMKLEKLKTQVKIQKKKSEYTTVNVNKPNQIKQDSFNQQMITLGSSVQVIGTNQIGIVQNITGKYVEVIFGNSLLKVQLQKLRFLK
ncbi:MAG: endonuclease MutS2 [Bacteroidota bacterium]